MARNGRTALGESRFTRSTLAAPSIAWDMLDVALLVVDLDAWRVCCGVSRIRPVRRRVVGKKCGEEVVLLVLLVFVEVDR